MAAWLVSFLTGLIEPIVMKLVKGFILDMQLNNIQKQSDAVRKSFEQLQKAETPDEMREAAKSIAASWNS